MGGKWDKRKHMQLFQHNFYFLVATVALPREDLKKLPMRL